MSTLVNGLERTAELRGSLSTRRRQGIEDSPFFSMPDADFVQLLGNSFGPEFDRLKSASPTVESITSHTEGALGRDSASPSRLLFGIDYAEVNRTIVGLLAMRWLVTRRYDDFTQHQNPAIRLSRSSFDDLRALFLASLQADKDVYALVVSTIVNDLGKDPTMIAEIAGFLKEHPDLPHPNHDKIVYIAAVHRTLPLVEEFKGTPMWSDLLAGLSFGSELNAAQLAQAENVPGNLQAARQMVHREHAFDLKFMELILDVAGADGHNDARCAKAMIEPVYQAFITSKHALQLIISDGCTLREAYDQVLVQRGRLLEQAGFRHLAVSDPPDRALLRLLTMGRTTSTAQADAFAAALAALDGPTRTALIDGLSVDGMDDGTAVLPYYIPALFAETLKGTRAVPAEIRVAALASLMRFLARVYRGTRPMPGQPGRIVECDLAFAQDVVKSAAFRADPRVLDRLDIPDERLSEPLFAGATGKELAVKV